MSRTTIYQMTHFLATLVTLEVSSVNIVARVASLFTASGTLRALYMGDNDLNSFPPSIDKFELLQVVLS